MSSRVVVDASLAASWVLPEQHSDAALRAAATWLESGVALLAPGLFSAELANALHQRVRRGEMPPDAALAALRTIAEFDVELVEEPGLPSRALSLASAHRRPSTYDCYYLALAEIVDCEYWTGDERFYNAVRAHERRVRFIGSLDT